MSDGTSSTRRSEIPRGTLVLKILAHGNGPLTLREILEASGDTSRPAQAKTVTALRYHRNLEKIDYLPDTSRRRAGGQYEITDLGRLALARALAMHPEWNDELPDTGVQTGSMRRDTPTVLRTDAIPGQITTNERRVNSVFSLGSLALVELQQPTFLPEAAARRPLLAAGIGS